MKDRPATRRDLKELRHRLLGTIRRSEMLADQCLEQAIDADLRPADRLRAEQNAIRASKTTRELVETLTRVEQALHEHAKDEAA